MRIVTSLFLGIVIMYTSCVVLSYTCIPDWIKDDIYSRIKCEIPGKCD